MCACVHACVRACVRVHACVCVCVCVCVAGEALLMNAAEGMGKIRSQRNLRPQEGSWLSLHSICYLHLRWFSWLIPVVYKMNMHLYISNWKRYRKKINVLILNFCSMLWRKGERIFLKGGKERGKEKEEGQKWKPTRARRLEEKTKGLTGNYVFRPWLPQQQRVQHVCTPCMLWGTSILPH